MFTVEAPAKINLSLVIKGKRPDGFHELETVMAPVSLSDRLDFTPADSFSFSSDAPDIPADETNLVVKAARLFERETGRAAAFHVHLTKRIPHGAGLGGGSSDAAATLKALDKLCHTDLGLEFLSGLGAELGSDVPFFLYDSLCVCRGRGEIIDPLEGAWRQHVLLVKPSFGVSTPDAYKAWAGARPLEGVLYDKQNVGGRNLVNDLEKPVFEKHIFLSVLKMWLLRQEEVLGAMMSGSGSTVFAVCKTEKKCKELEVRLNFLDKSLWTSVVATC